MRVFFEFWSDDDFFVVFDERNGLHEKRVNPQKLDSRFIKWEGVWFKLIIAFNPMRYLIKGGGWKNYEDEILKAAVMKYGLNQWSRISSLLVRKSAKQCKARWYEWLDPSIKKTEWTKEEEEKLLHLSKIFPSQWRTIAPIVGRTPAQCVEHYERLLDMAQGRDGQEDNDPRRLKPGEIDPAPETRPARPDPIDFDDDEREMIAEARVRLANTKGKKAKRKAREKVIERARIQAMLQKERELKMAGLEYNVRRNMRKLVDYNIEVPFKRKPINVIAEPGPEESPKVQPHVGNISLQGLEGARRDEEEEKLRKLDQKRLKKLREVDLPAALENSMKALTLGHLQPSKMILGEPQLNDSDLESLARLTKMQTKITCEFSQDSTKALIGNYSIRDPTPMRTPRYEDTIMKQAQNALARKNGETPLNTGNEKIKSLQPPKPNISTPNTLKQRILESPLRGQFQREGQMSTPRRMSSEHGSTSTSLLRRERKSGGSSMREATPLRDEFKINSYDGISSAWEELRNNDEKEMAELLSLEEKQVQLRERILENIQTSLPAPKHSYDIEEMQEMEEETIEYKRRLKVDQEDVDGILERNRAKERRKIFKQNSRVIQLGLPRPCSLDGLIQSTKMEIEGNERDLLEEAENEIKKEMAKVILADMIEFPFRGMQPPEEDFQGDSEPLTNEEIKQAKKLIKEEMQKMGPIKEKEISELGKEAFEHVLDLGSGKMVKREEGPVEMAQEALRKRTATLERLMKLENAVDEAVKGEQTHLETEISQKQETARQMIEKCAELEQQISFYEKIHDHEKTASQNRLQKEQDFEKKLLAKETELQMIFRNLKRNSAE